VTSPLTDSPWKTGREWQYYPVLNTPVHASVTLLTPEPFKAKLQEDIVDGDPDVEWQVQLTVGFEGVKVRLQTIAGIHILRRDVSTDRPTSVDSKSKVGLPCHCGEVTAHITAAEEAGAVGVPDISRIRR
jgi:N-acetylated-alpha-linked acidic dipeptidase